MNVKKVSKIISAMLIVLLLVSVATTVFAVDPNLITGDPTTPGADKVQDVGQKVLGIIQVAGSVVAVIILAVLGIKYMMGSAEEKAEYKKVMIPYLIGAVLIFAAPYIADAIYTFSTNNFKG